MTPFMEQCIIIIWNHNYDPKLYLCTQHINEWCMQRPSRDQMYIDMTFQCRIIALFRIEYKALQEALIMTFIGMEPSAEALILCNT